MISMFEKRLILLYIWRNRSTSMMVLVTKLNVIHLNQTLEINYRLWMKFYAYQHQPICDFLEGCLLQCNQARPDIRLN